ncbi:MAG: efflux RND transporter permease subunit [Solirubrobacterales bacterium]|nr:efflux RND transporter permease subunit [Solirubrobacterales bacterium]
MPSARLHAADPPLIGLCKRGYTKLLVPVLRRPRYALAVVLAAILGGALVLPRLGQDLFPSFKEHDLLLHFDSKPGTSLPEMKRIVARLQQRLLAVPGVTHVGAHIGQALLGEEIAGPEFSEQWITLAPNADPTRAAERVRAVAASFPGTFADVTTYLHERIDETLSSTSEDLVMRISGPDFGTLQRLSQQVMSRLASTPHLVDVHPQSQGFIPQIQETVNAPMAARYGLTPGDVRRDAALLLGSVEVGEISAGGIALGVTAYSTPQTRRTLTDVNRLLIDTPGGGHVALGKVAKLTVNETASGITRVDGSNKIDVTANADGGNLGAVTSAVRAKLAQIRLPLGYHVELLGQAAERQAAQNRLLGMGLGAAIAILFLLQAAFQSVRLATLMFLTLPVALVGGVLLAWAVIGSISLGALIGLFAVLGIAARNGILLICHLQHLEREEGVPFGRELVIRGARERLSPILMTALATALALVPLVIYGNRPGQEIENPMAIVILGGLATSTLMNLFVVPALYLRFGGPRDGERGWRGRLGVAPRGPAAEREPEPEAARARVTVMQGEAIA